MAQDPRRRISYVKGCRALAASCTRSLFGDLAVTLVTSSAHSRQAAVPVSAFFTPVEPPGSGPRQQMDSETDTPLQIIRSKKGDFFGVDDILTRSNRSITCRDWCGFVYLFVGHRRVCRL